MQWWFPSLKNLAVIAAGCCCALSLSTTSAQAPVNPLRAASTLQPIARSSSNVRPVQATESLPTPLRRAPAEPDMSPPIAPSDESVLAPNTLRYMTNEPPPDWPADAPVQQHYGPGHSANAYPPREPWFSHNTPNDPGRHTGWGDPLTGTSWLNRPWYVGIFVGGMLADDLVGGTVEADSAPILGLRLGNDFDHYWGWEIRYAYSRVETFNRAGVPIAEPGREYYVDVALLHYPWGDSRWRPYLLAGVGFMNARYENGLGQAIDDTALTIPLGVGLKLYNSPWFTIRFDAVDNWSFEGSHLDSMHNFSLMVGCEFRFGGGNHPSYFPWTGNTSYW